MTKFSTFFQNVSTNKIVNLAIENSKRKIQENINWLNSSLKYVCEYLENK